MDNWVNRAEVIERIVDAVCTVPVKEINSTKETSLITNGDKCPCCGSKCDYDIPDTNYCVHCGQRIVVEKNIVKINSESFFKPVDNNGVKPV